MVDLRRAPKASRPDVDADRVDALSRELGEPQKLALLRNHAREAWSTTALPPRSKHLWRYTAPDRLFPTGELIPARPDAPGALPPSSQGGAVALLRGGAHPRVWLSDEARAAGVRVVPLPEAGDLIDRLGTAVPPEHGLFEALNGAVWTSGLAVHVPRGVVLTEPVHIRVDADAETTSTRVLVLIDEGAEASIFEEHIGGSAGNVVLNVTELLVGAAAHVRHVLVQRWASGVHGHLTLRSRVERDASVEIVLASLGGEVAKLDIGGSLVGEGARHEIVGVVLGDEGQHMDHHTEHQHLAPHTGSNIDIKAAVAGEARSAYTGVIRIAEHAIGSEAYQENRNLLLSETSHIETIPELEILTDDVVCTHGATVAPVDAEQLFYLQSRCLTPRDALRLLLSGFLEKTMSRIPSRLRAELETMVEERITRIADASTSIVQSTRPPSAAVSEQGAKSDE